MQKALVLISIVAALFLITGCSTTKSDPNRVYFTGTQGVDMQFSDSGSPPLKMYYFTPTNAQDFANTFTVSVDLHNKGASFTRGGVYLSGFDPGMIRFREFTVEEGSWGDCVLDFSGFGDWTNFLSYFSCVGVSGEYQNNEHWGININRLGTFLNSIFGTRQEGTYDWFNNIRFSFGQDGDRHFQHINFNGTTADIMNLGVGLMIAISGIDFERFNGQEYYLAGNTQYYPGGQTEYKIFNGEIYQWPQTLDHVTQTLMITNCYAYATYAAPDVCIDPSPFSEDRKVCRSGQVFSKGTQGAPVAITSVSSEPTPLSVIFTIKVRNIAKGNVIDPGYLERCSPYFPGDLNSKHMNIVYLGDIRIGNERLRCTDDHIRLDPKTKSGEIICTYSMQYASMRSAYKTPLIIELWYGYSDTMSRNVYIKRAI
jgi:hypothetical protein